MTGEVPRGRARLRRRATAERLSGFIYGTIVVLAVIVGGNRAYPDDAGRIAAMVGVTSIVLWLAHVYAHSIQHSVAHDEHLSVAALRRIARREASIVEAAVPPLVALLLGALGVISTNAAVWGAFALGLTVLAAQGVAFARVERLGLLGAVAVVLGNIALGGALVALKLFLSH